MNCPSCAQPSLIRANRCSHCGALLPDEDAGPPPEMRHSGSLELFGIALVILAALIFLGGAKADAGGAVGFAIVLFVIGMITTAVGYRSVVER